MVMSCLVVSSAKRGRKQQACGRQGYQYDEIWHGDGSWPELFRMRREKQEIVKTEEAKSLGENFTATHTPPNCSTWSFPQQQYVSSHNENLLPPMAPFVEQR
jgi:hypothetical protein